MVKTLPTNAGDVGFIPGSGRPPGEGNDKPLQYSCLGNPVDRGVWWATVRGVAKELEVTEPLSNKIKQVSSASNRSLIPCGNPRSYSGLHACQTGGRGSWGIYIPVPVGHWLRSAPGMLTLQDFWFSPECLSGVGCSPEGAPGQRDRMLASGSCPRERCDGNA